MSRRILHIIGLTLVLLCAGQMLPGQDSVFAFVHRPQQGRFAPRPVTGQKYIAARQVFDRLVEAHGNYNMPIPAFVMNTGETYIAWMDPQRREVGLEEKAYDLCASFGADSLHVLAGVLAHELIHYYEKHNWQRHFVRAHSSGNPTEAVLKESTQLEAESDFLGGVLALSAGFNPYRYADTFLAKAYEAYGYPPGLAGYPELAARQKNSRVMADSLRKTGAVLALGNLLTTIGAYDQARSYYDYTLGIYQGYEVLQNAGVNLAMLLLDMAGSERMPYAWPLEQNATNRLQNLPLRNADSGEQAYANLLQQAGRLFQSALLQAPVEPASHLNQAFLLALQEKWFDAEYHVQKALRLTADPKDQARAQVAQGIILAMQEQNAAAHTWLEKARSDLPVLVEYNVRVLNGEAPPASDWSAGTSAQPEMIDGLFLGDFMDNPDPDLVVALPNDIQVGYKAYPSSELLVHYARNGREYVVFQLTALTSAERTRKGIGPGDTRAQILSSYGTPDRIQTTSAGAWLIYTAPGLLFQVDKEGILVQWGVFACSF